MLALVPKQRVKDHLRIYGVCEAARAAAAEAHATLEEAACAEGDDQVRLRVVAELYAGANRRRVAGQDRGTTRLRAQAYTEHAARVPSFPRPWQRAASHPSRHG